jgi:hypothetical protein
MKSILMTMFLLAGITLQGQNTLNIQITPNMKVAVWDTYVTKKDGSIMHFDIIAPESVRDTNIIYQYGREYLKTKGQEGQTLSSKQCRFCHVRTIQSQWEEAIRQKGYYILELEGCK